MPQCPQCKSTLPMKSKFCPKCGTAIPHSTWVHNVNYNPGYENSEFYHFIMSVLPKGRRAEYEGMEGGFERDEEFMGKHPDLQFALKEYQRIFNDQFACREDRKFQSILEWYDNNFFTKMNPEPFDFALRFDDEEWMRFDRYIKDFEGIMESQNTKCYVAIFYERGSAQLSVSILGHRHSFRESELGYIPPYVKYMLSILYESYFRYIRGFDPRNVNNEDAALHIFSPICM